MMSDFVLCEMKESAQHISTRVKAKLYLLQDTSVREKISLKYCQIYFTISYISRYTRQEGRRETYTNTNLAFLILTTRTASTIIGTVNFPR